MSDVEMGSGGDAQKARSATIPIVEEKLTVGAQQRVTGRVVVRIEPHASEQTIDVPLKKEAADVERVRVEWLVEEAPKVRQEGDILIIPLVEEVIVVEKKLMLREEIRINRRQSTRVEQQSVTLRSESADIQHLDAGDEPLTHE